MAKKRKTKRIKCIKQVDPVIAVMDRAMREFEKPSAWRTSAKGNRWRMWQGATVTLFRREDDYWGWCVSDSEGKRFSPCGYDNEEEAICTLMEELAVGM